MNLYIIYLFVCLFGFVYFIYCFCFLFGQSNAKREKREKRKPKEVYMLYNDIVILYIIIILNKWGFSSRKMVHVRGNQWYSPKINQTSKKKQKKTSVHGAPPPDPTAF